MTVNRSVLRIYAFIAALHYVDGIQGADLGNTTRAAGGDFFTLTGDDCGPTRCMETSHGTALVALGSKLGKCVCQCRHDLPTFREDTNQCVREIEECQMAAFGLGGEDPSIPFIFLPHKGQIINPSQEIIFTDVKNSICAVTSAQYLSHNGWVTLRDIVDNDVPFGLFRDEGKTFLLWLGSSVLHTKLEGRVIAVHVLCSAPPRHVASPCAVFRIAGSSEPIAMPDIKSVKFGDGITITAENSTSSHGLSILESLAIGFCALMLIFIYSAGIIFYVHFKKKQRRKKRSLVSSNTFSTDNSSLNDPRLEMDNLNMKTNPLMKLDPYGMTMRTDGFSHHDSALSDVSERTEETLDPPPSDHSTKKPHIIAAMVHTTRKKSTRIVGKSKPLVGPRQLSDISAPIPISRGIMRTPSPDLVERRPSSEVAIVENNADLYDDPPPGTVSSLRRKLYFNPDFFELEHLKNPPPAAKEFLVKIREVMTVAKEKMVSKRFNPILNAIPEEEYYKTIDFGWDIPPCARGRKLSVVSLKRENTRRRHPCSGCPGCEDHTPKAPVLARSNSCKSCLSEEFKQRIVRKWLDDVPVPVHNKAQPPQRSIAKVSGTPRVVQPKNETESEPKLVTPKPQQVEKSPSLESTTTPSPPTSTSPPRVIRRPRRKMPPPPPPPTDIAPIPIDEPLVLPEVKMKMEAVIKELSKCQMAETKTIEDHSETVKPMPSKERVMISVVTVDSLKFNEIKPRKEVRPTQISRIALKEDFEADSLERGMRSRRFSLAFGDEQFYGSNSSSQSAEFEDRSLPFSEVFIDPPQQCRTPQPGALTIKVHGSPEPELALKVKEEFDPDTLDRKPGRKRFSAPPPPVGETRKVDKILLRSAGSFKLKSTESNNLDTNHQQNQQSLSIGSLRQIFEAKARAAKTRRSSYDYGEMTIIPTISDDLGPPDLILHVNGKPKPPLPPKQNGQREKVSTSEEGDMRSLKFRWSERARRSTRRQRQRARSPRKGKPEDSGYLSTDSNESKRKSRFVLRLKAPPQAVDSDSEGSACDAHSESGGESVETNSVLFGRYAPTLLDDAAPDSGFVAQDSDCDKSVVSVLSGNGLAIHCG